MHILYLHQYFSTRQGLGGTRSYEMARALVSKGHEVTMVCSGVDNEPRLSTPPGQDYHQTMVDGVRCIALRAGYADGRKGTGLSGWRRMASFYQFAAAAKRIGELVSPPHTSPPDIVLATHTPLTIGLPAITFSRRFGIPFVFEVRDLWPDALIRIGALRNPLAIAWLRRLERKIYRAADHIIALSPGMKAGVTKAGVAPHRITMIPNGCDLDLFHPDLPRQWGRRKLQLGDRFAAIYFGAMGLANGLDLLLRAGQVLQSRGEDHIAIVLHGDGGKRKELQSTACAWRLKNVIFSSSLPDKTEVAQLVASCDVCLTVYKSAKEHTWSPNKMFDALSAGKPIITNTPGWISEVIQNNHCGVSVPPEDPIALAEALLHLSKSPQLVRMIGQNSRKTAERDFARNKLANQMETVLLHTLQRRAGVRRLPQAA